MTPKRVRRARVRPIGVAVWLCAGSCACTAHDDLAAVLVRAAAPELSDAGGPGPPGNAGAPMMASDVLVIGQPMDRARWPHPVAQWPLGMPLARFFEGDRPPRGKPVLVRGPDARALRVLWAAAERGEYGPARDSVMVEDATGQRYLVLFRSP